jgi:hypothetical protein
MRWKNPGGSELKSKNKSRGCAMSKKMNFDSLVSLCGQTHLAMQQQAARSVNIGLVVRNWLFG